MLQRLKLRQKIERYWQCQGLCTGPLHHCFLCNRPVGGALKSHFVSVIHALQADAHELQAPFLGTQSGLSMPGKVPA